MLNDDDKFYVTTPIYYVNSRPHIGTSYTTVIADVAARFHRMQGQRALLVTGADEHSQNIADRAAEAGLSPREYCDQIIPSFHDCWKMIQIQDYVFERTSDDKHAHVVRTFWQRIFDHGDVYKGSYSGWYHTSDNRFLDDDEVPEHPDEHPLLKFLTEEAYYFRLSKYEQWLTEFHEANPEFIVPDFRRHEMLNRIKDGLKDICISRTSTDWGVRLPWDESHVLYVWVDALLTYLTGSGFDIDAFERTFVNGKSSETVEPLWDTTRAHLKSQPEGNFWPCDLHIMAIDIPWFHAVIWPAMLRSYGCPPPKQMLVHGYWNFAGTKMSKSLGNVVDPYDAVQLVGVDGLRYFLLREVPLGLDGGFNHESLVNRFNYDLANDLGNLVHRSVSLAHQLFGGVVPEVLAVTALDDELESHRRAYTAQVLEHMADLHYSEALQAVWDLVREANRYIDDKKPWELKKKPERRDEISTVLNRLLNVIYTVLLLAYPVVPGAANRFWRILNLPGTVEDQRANALRRSIPAGHKLNATVPVFQRIDAEAVLGGAPAEAAVQAPAAEAPPASPASQACATIEDFAKLELRVAVVREAARVAGADKLLRLTVDDGGRLRQIVAGIAQQYTPEEMLGKSIVLLANLEPRKLRGLESQGMLLAATGPEGALSLVTPERPVAPGSKIS
jgi:methionyl-tRNA synthetase